MEEAGGIRDAIARWAEQTQTLLDELTRLLDTHDQLVGQVALLRGGIEQAEQRADQAERRIEHAEQRAEDAERRSMSSADRAAKLAGDVVSMKDQLEGLRRDRERLESALAQPREHAGATSGAAPAAMER
ncbi:MAG: hypothetical protein FJ027_19140, partial [Candidatus Rokubacteria bacterium]|nr:hypothetical protein [Candidatus Rokubacteria bacterium]